MSTQVTDYKALVKTINCNTDQCSNQIEFFLTEQGCYPWETNVFLCYNCMSVYAARHVDKVKSIQRVDLANIQDLIKLNKETSYASENAEQKAINGL